MRRKCTEEPIIEIFKTGQKEKQKVGRVLSHNCGLFQNNQKTAKKNKKTDNKYWNNNGMFNTNNLLLGTFFTFQNSDWNFM